METELFLTAANYSLPENGEKYLESLKNTPKAPVRCYNYALWLYPGFVFKLGRAKHPPGSAWEKLYELKAISGESDRFTEVELNGFERQRKSLVSVLDQIVSGKPLSNIEELGGLLLTASQLTRDDKFNLGSEEITSEEMPLYPWTPKEKRRSTPACVKPEQNGRVMLIYNALNPVFNLVCYGLSVFLADAKHRGKDRIKKCPICEKFFPAKDKKRKLCYENPLCFTEYKRLQKQKQREVDPVKYI